MHLCDICRNNCGAPRNLDSDINKIPFDLYCRIYGDIDNRNFCNNFNLIEQNDLEN